MNKTSMIQTCSEALLRLGKRHKRMVLLHADFGGKIGAEPFATVFDGRSFNFGLAEENMFLAASGFAVRGKLPFVLGYASFVLRGLQKIRDNICYPNLNVKIIGVGAGFMYGREGVGYQATEDVAVLRVLPNMKIWAPADAAEFSAALDAMFDDFGPCYLRISEDLARDLGVGAEGAGARIGAKFGRGARILVEGNDACIFAYGPMVAVALEASALLAKEGLALRVVNVPVIKPFDVDGVFSKGLGCGRWFSLEDHSVIGGLGGAMAEALAEASGQKPGFLRLGVGDLFGESLSREHLYRKCGLVAEVVAEKVKGAVGK